MPLETNFNEVAGRMGSAAGNGYTMELYNGTDGSGLYAALRTSTGGWTQVANNASVPALSDGIWYDFSPFYNSTTIGVNLNRGAYVASGTDSTYSSGAVGPALDPNAVTQYGTIFVYVYAATVPNATVGSETAGNY
jgi:hypothetical protein